MTKPHLPTPPPIRLSTHLMVDIETLSHHVTAPVIQFAAVSFTSTAILDSFVANVYPEFSNDSHPSAQTLEWWYKQVSNHNTPIPLDLSAPQLTSVLEHFRAYFTFQPHTVWSNDPDFDLAILNHYSNTHYLPPFSDFHTHRSYRTLMSLVAPHIALPLRDHQHDALDDALYQARAVIEANNYLAQHNLSIL